MKAANAQRAAILVDALRNLPDITGTMRRSKPQSTWSFFGMRLGIADLGLDGSDDFGCVNIEGWIDIDIKTARLLVPLLRKLIEDELRKLGVTP